LLPIPLFLSYLSLHAVSPSLPSFYVCFFFFMIQPPPPSTLFPYTTLFRSQIGRLITISTTPVIAGDSFEMVIRRPICGSAGMPRSEERFSRNAETDLVCRLLLEKNNR